jgi:hypothetical protein
VSGNAGGRTRHSTPDTHHRHLLMAYTFPKIA